MPVTGRSRELIQRYLEGIASGEELTELETLLATEPEIADAFVEAVRLDSALGDFFRRQYKMDQVAALLREPAASRTPPRTVSQSSGDTSKSAERPDQAAASEHIPDSVFVARDTRPLSVRRGDSNGRMTVSQHRRPWKRAAAVLLLLLIGIAWSTFRSPSKTQWQLISGRISASGQEVSVIAENTPFEVTGSDSAILESTDGARFELTPSTQATIRRESLGTVLVLTKGGGEFHLAENSLPLRIETGLGVVNSQKGRFSLSLVRNPPPAHFSSPNRERYPRLTVVVIEGSVTVQQGGSSVKLAAGQQDVFYS